MRKRVMFFVTVVCGCLLAAGCGDSKGNKDAVKAGADVHSAAQEPVPPSWEGEYQCKKGDGECRDDKNLGDGVFFGGIVFNTVINADVNARSEPSSKGGNSTVLGQIKKDTKVQILGISKDGWAFVTTREVVPRRGWVSGQFVDYIEGQKLKSTEMKITDFTLTSKDSSTADLTAAYKVGSVEKSMKLSAFKQPGQKFFTFFCDTYTDNSHYSIIPGLYTWHFAKNQLNHSAFLTRSPITHNDDSIIWEKVWFTDDLKFYVVEDGTYIDITGSKILVFQANGSPLLDNVSIKSFNPRTNTIITACPSDAQISEYFKDAEEMDGVIKEYLIAEDDKSCGSDDPFYFPAGCEVNLETGARKITGIDYSGGC